MKKLAIFDMDGTLADTLMVNFRSYERALKEEGVVLTYECYMQKCFGRGYRDFLPEIVNGDREAVERVHDRKSALYPDYIPGAKLNEALAAFIRSAKDLYYMAVVTTAARVNVERILDYFSLLEDFDLILTAEDIPRLKPDPMGFLMAMEHFGVTAEDTVIFEDSEPGLEAAEAVGAGIMKVVKI